MSNFKSLGLSPKLCEVLDQLGFEQPTPIQEQAIPQLLSNNPTDFIGLAQTGTGKTAAFGLPLIDLIDLEDDSTQAIVMAPTRELGQQTAKQLQSFVANQRKLNVEVVYGGVDISKQIRALKKPVQIVVATPGRLIDLIERRAVSLDAVRYVVLDEADEMLNMGFKEDIDRIISYTQDDRSIWLFSATMPQEIRRIVDKYMNTPIEVAVNTHQKSNLDIAHQYAITKTANKLAAIRRFLDIQPDMRGIMFCRTKRETQEFADAFSNMGYGVEALHGDLSQGQRDAVMKRFKARSMQLLIATDVAARGIDVNDLTHVIHHSLPDQLESYTHRSGRTGRAGRKGISLAFINPREGRKIKELENKLGVKFELVEVPNKNDLKYSRINHWANLILKTKVDEEVNDLMAHLNEDLLGLSKNDLLKRLLSLQLDHLAVDNGTNFDEPDDLNEVQGKREDRGGAVVNRDGSQRFFINVGDIDGATKADLVHFLVDVSGYDKGAFKEVEVKKNCSFFYLDPVLGKDISSKFRGISVNGRAIRVNEDTDGPPRDSKKQKNRNREFGFEKRNRRKERARPPRKGRRR
ncbi:MULTISPECIES: DEAD/DEAH box helicase [Roseivirga]|uniref:DEAD/DEAH box helicase n=1 Tax=Roseivirga TaxID=290180 RepID=UPI001673E7F9|nr:MULTISPECIES: DEAD/DEAH box helicase [Roseivirga]